MEMEYTVLSNNIKMPMEGFGVFQVTDKEECKQSVLSAIRTGYRLIDTAAVYGAEPVPSHHNAPVPQRPVHHSLA